MAKTSGAPARPADAAPPARAERASPSGGEPLGTELRDFQAACSRRVQLTKRGWNRFDAKKKKLFLKWFAATCNAKEAARRAGVGYSTVFDHRMDDPAFAGSWDRALEQGYARIEAKLLEMQFGQAIAKTAELDAADDALVDPEMAMQLLRQHRSQVARIRGDRGMPASPFRGGSERLASDAEVRAGLVKSLRAFGVRVTAADMRDDPTSADDPAGASPDRPA